MSEFYTNEDKVIQAWKQCLVENTKQKQQMVEEGKLGQMASGVAGGIKNAIKGGIQGAKQAYGDRKVADQQAAVAQSRQNVANIETKFEQSMVSLIQQFIQTLVKNAQADQESLQVLNNIDINTLSENIITAIAGVINQSFGSQLEEIINGNQQPQQMELDLNTQPQPQPQQPQQPKTFNKKPLPVTRA